MKEEKLNLLKEELEAITKEREVASASVREARRLLELLSNSLVELSSRLARVEAINHALSHDINNQQQEKGE